MCGPCLGAGHVPVAEALDAPGQGPGRGRGVVQRAPPCCVVQEFGRVVPGCLGGGEGGGQSLPGGFGEDLLGVGRNRVSPGQGAGTARDQEHHVPRPGRRAVPLPGPLGMMLRTHKEAQKREREIAGNLWMKSEYVFTKPLGGPLSPNTDYHDWKRLLEDAGVRDGRLHDAATRPARS